MTQHFPANHLVATDAVSFEVPWAILIFIFLSFCESKDWPFRALISLDIDYYSPNKIKWFRRHFGYYPSTNSSWWPLVTSFSNHLNPWISLPTTLFSLSSARAPHSQILILLFRRKIISSPNTPTWCLCLHRRNLNNGQLKIGSFWRLQDPRSDTVPMSTCTPFPPS